jgi:hypothetical protein
VSRQKHALSEELLTARRDLEKAQQAYDRILMEKENLNLDKGELVVQVCSTLFFKSTYSSMNENSVVVNSFPTK